MKLLKGTILSLVIMSVSGAQASADSVEALLQQLDREIENSGEYVAEKERRINELRIEKAKSNGNWHNSYDLNRRIFNEYRSYVCDSAIKYMKENIEIGISHGDVKMEYDSKLQLADLLASAGYYSTSMDMLRTIRKNMLTPEQEGRYFRVWDHVYGELGASREGALKIFDYHGTSAQYRDSVEQFKRLHPEFDNDKSPRATEGQMLDTGKLDEAMKINDGRLAKVKEGSHEHAIIMFDRSRIFSAKGDTDKELECLIHSAISDIKQAVSDHASLWKVAKIINDRGDVERANRYIRYSWQATSLYDAPLRNLQSANIQSIIEQQYQNQIIEQRDVMRIGIVVITALSLLVILALIYIWRQHKKLSIAHNEVKSSNTQLQTLNSELQKLNSDLQTINAELSRSNNIKEVYISRFIKLCSTYIDKLEKFRLMVNKNLTSGKSAELLRITKSPDMINEDVQELYKNFDVAFLHIYPDFVDKFNELLIDEEKFVLKNGELLNTELRIFALIKLGINDGQQIADFLRYSVNTIYNYRAKVKKKAKVSKTDFEDLVREIH